MTKSTGGNPNPVTKPFLTGTVTDETTLKSALIFFGSLLLVGFMSFLISATTAGAALWIRLLLNAAIIILILSVFYNNGTGRGTDAVSRGEILWQRQEKGQAVSQSEKSLCYHGLKGFAVGILGTLPLLIPALMLAFMTKVQTTDSGTLPSWIQTYVSREEVGGALVHYTQPQGMAFVDYIRLIVRLFLMPFVNIAGSSNRLSILWVERFSPLLTLLPAAVYGFGYRTGRKNRTRIHTAISENNRIRIRREKKARKARLQGSSRKKEPEQLN